MRLFTDQDVARGRCGSRWASLTVTMVVLAACAQQQDPTILVGALPAVGNVVAEQPPTAVYAILAQKALACWMGPKGPLKSTHIFHAEAASPTSGGRAEIVLQERVKTAAHPWGARAFRIELTDVGGGTNTSIEMENIKLPADLAEALRTDVVDWAQGKDGCQAQVVRPPPPDLAPAVKPKPSRAKSGG